MSTVQKNEEGSLSLEPATWETAILFLDCEGYCKGLNNGSIIFLDKLTGGLYSKHLSELGSQDFNILKALRPENQAVLMEHLQKCQGEDNIVKSILQFQSPQGGYRHLEVISFPGCQKDNYFLSLVHDLNYLYSLNAMLVRLEELNLVGKIAGSVAHEVRNPLTVVRGHLQLLTWDKALANVNERLETMIMEIDRAVEILNELLYMSRPRKPRMERENINTILNNLYQLLNAEALVNLHEVVYELEEVPDVMLDKKKFRQVVLNLVNNGLQAMEEHGKVIIRTYSKDGKVYFSVKDHGKGIPPEILQKLGTPFLTTKTNGTGLGLAACYNIIAEHKAKMEVETGPEETTFTVIFNAAD
ncbi:MAG TPA: hypothetical protein GXX46_02330 [Peptococcaceae bacterium]|nr:hypothetical protein [Peptococcaceae bacterium]